MRLGGILSILVGLSLFSCGDNPQVDEAERDEAMFVQNSRSGIYNGKEIILNNVSPVVYFTQAPKPEAGIISATDFSDLWADGQETSADTTKGTLSIHTPNGDRNVAVELMKPMISGDRVTYKVRVILGSIPRQFGESTLFIDFGDTWRVPQGETL